MEFSMIRKCAENAANQGIAIVASMLFRSAIRPLLDVDERSLLTVGLTRADLIECLSTPFTRDPTEMLASRAESCARTSQPCRQFQSDTSGSATLPVSSRNGFQPRSFPCPG
jgi:hypothetical protein